MCWGSGSVSSVISLGNLALAIQSSRVPGITHLFHETSVYPASLVAQKVESACNTGDLGSTPELGRSPGKGNGNPLQYSCLENPMDGGAWQATVHGVPKSQT